MVMKQQNISADRYLSTSGVRNLSVFSANNLTIVSHTGDYLR